MSSSDTGSGSGSASDSTPQKGGDITKKSDVDKRKRLLYACKVGRLVDVEELVGGGHITDPKSCLASNPHRDTLLHIAAYHGRKNIVEYLIKAAKWDAELRNRYLNTPLHRAAQQGKLEIVKYLIEDCNCDPVCVCNWGRTPLHNACKHGRLEVVKYLMNNEKVGISARDRVNGSTPLHLAAEFGTLEVVQYMMENSAFREYEPNTHSPLHLAAYGGKLETVKYLIQNSMYDPLIKGRKGRTPLHSACASGQLIVVKYYIDELKLHRGMKCRDNSFKLSPLEIAAEHGALNVVRYIVGEKGYEVEHGIENTNTALHQAAYGGRLAVVRYLIAGGYCSPSCRGWRGRNALHSACTTGEMEVMEYLIDDCKVYAAIIDERGDTPLHLAAKHGHLSLVKRLIKYGCDPYVVDYSDKTPSDYASDIKITEFLSHVDEVVSMSIEEAELIVKQALEKEGSRVKQKNLVVVITGLMEAGKSTLLNRLFGERPPDEYTSTGVSEGPWRGLTRDTLDIKKFKRLSLEDIFKSVAPLLERSERVEGHKSKSGTSGKQEQDDAIHEHQEDGEMKVQSVVETHSSGEAYAVKKMARHVPKEPQDYTLEIAFIVDTGGQPECLEVLPTVLHNTNLAILVVDLSRSLDANPQPTMHEKGYKYGKRVPLLCSNRQIIEQTAHTISGRTNSSLLVVGSHADCKWNDSVVSDMNEHLKAVIPKDRYYGIAKHHSIFTVDLKNYDTDKDKETIEQIRTCIEGHEAEEILLPPSFVMFEYQVMKHFENELAETRKVWVMTFQECVDIGKELKMEKKKVEAALQYFHKNNIFLFFSHELVFLRPQALLNFVNTIVSLSYKEKICPPLKAQQIDDLSNGIITEELLKHRYIADNLVTGVFEASHAIKIFKDLHTMAKQGEGKYIMMCLLPRLERKVFEEKEQSLIRECTLAEPLVLHFGKYCAPNGCFGNTIACLMSRKRYQIEYTDLNEDTPECLTHDIVTLRPSRKRFKVTLVNNTKHFTVYVHLKKESQSKTCYQDVRDEIVSAVRDVLETMHIDKTKMDVNEGFKCSKCSKIIPLPNTEEETLYCEGHHEELPLEPKYIVWGRDEKGGPTTDGTAQANYATSTDTGLSEKLDINIDTRKVNKLLKSLDKDHLKELFRELGLYDATLINRYSDSVIAYADDLITAWIQERDGVLTVDDYPGGATWENLRKALQELGHNGIAAAIII